MTMGQRIERDVLVTNDLGLHARPASKLAQAASRFDADIELKKDGICANAKSILGLLTLACPKGTVLTLSAEGADAEIAVVELAQLFENGFGETITAAE